VARIVRINCDWHIICSSSDWFLVLGEINHVAPSHDLASYRPDGTFHERSPPGLLASSGSRSQIGHPPRHRTLSPSGNDPPRKPSPQYFKVKRRELRHKIPPINDIPTKYIVREGNAVEAILEIAQHWDVDQVVMGTHGRTGLKHLFMGSIAEKVVRRANCPVLTVKLPFVEKSVAVTMGTNRAGKKKRVETAVRNVDPLEGDFERTVARR
jgi:hypothetical protein